jgi:hypothetical protein
MRQGCVLSGWHSTSAGEKKHNEKATLRAPKYTTDRYRQKEWKKKIVTFVFRWPCISLQFFPNDQLDALFSMYLFITPLYMFRANQCSSSGDRIVLIHHLVWLVCVGDCLVCIPGSHLHRVTHTHQMTYWHNSILLMMSTGLLEICTEGK